MLIDKSTGGTLAVEPVPDLLINDIEKLDSKSAP